MPFTASHRKQDKLAVSRVTPTPRRARRAHPCGDRARTRSTTAAFLALARAICSRYQLAPQPAYAAFARSRGVDGAHLPARVEDIPAVPAAAFKEARLAAFAPAETALWFETSGTTRRRAAAGTSCPPPALRSRAAGVVRPLHAGRRRAAALPQPRARSARAPAQLARLHDGRRWRASAATAAAAGTCAATRSTWTAFVRDVERGARRRRRRVRRDDRVRARRTARRAGRSAAAARRFRPARASWRPAASRAARASSNATSSTRDAPRRSACRTSRHRRRIRHDRAVRAVLRCAAVARADERRIKAAAALAAAGRRGGDGPRAAATGIVGAIRHIDCANRGSAIAIETEDLARCVGGGLVLLGREQGAELRGCSLDAETLLARLGVSAGALRALPARRIVAARRRRGRTLERRRFPAARARDRRDRSAPGLHHAGRRLRARPAVRRHHARRARSGDRRRTRLRSTRSTASSREPARPAAWARGVDRVTIVSSDTTIGVAIVPALLRALRQVRRDGERPQRRARGARSSRRWPKSSPSSRGRDRARLDRRRRPGRGRAARRCRRRRRLRRRRGAAGDPRALRRRCAFVPFGHRASIGYARRAPTLAAIDDALAAARSRATRCCTTAKAVSRCTRCSSKRDGDATLARFGALLAEACERGRDRVSGRHARAGSARRRCGVPEPAAFRAANGAAPRCTRARRRDASSSTRRATTPPPFCRGVMPVIAVALRRRRRGVRRRAARCRCKRSASSAPTTRARRRSPRASARCASRRSARCRIRRSAAITAARARIADFVRWIDRAMSAEPAYDRRASSRRSPARARASSPRALARYEAPGVTYLGDDYPGLVGARARRAGHRRRRQPLSRPDLGVRRRHDRSHQPRRVARRRRASRNARCTAWATSIRPRSSAQLLEALAALAPGELRKTYLATRGAEAIEFALKTALLATGKPRVLAFRARTTASRWARSRSPASRSSANRSRRSSRSARPSCRIPARAATARRALDAVRAALARDPRSARWCSSRSRAAAA